MKYNDTGFSLLSGTLSNSGLPNFIDGYLGEFPFSISSVSSPNNFNLYPNPATNQLTVETTKAINTIEIIDALGRRVSG